MHDLVAARYGVDAQQGARRPVLFADANGNFNEQFSGSSNGAVRNNNKAVGADTGVRYTTGIGTQLELKVETQASARKSNTTLATTRQASVSYYTATATATARQPLLRGAGTDAVLAPVRQAELQRNQAQQERDNQAAQVVLDVLTAYWELWYAQEALRVQQKSLQSVGRQREEMRQRAEELGTAARTDVLRLSSEVASTRDAVAQARTSVSTRSLDLARVLGIEAPSAGKLDVVDAPPGDFDVPSLKRLQDAAMRDSAELRSLKAQVETARDKLRVADDAAQAKLDLTATGTMSGLWMNDNLQGLRLPDGRPAYGAMVGLEFELPLGESQQTAQAHQAAAALAAAEARYRARRESLAAEVAQTHAALTAAADQVAYATEAAEIARELAQAERDRMALGTGTSTDVVQAEQAVREAELRRLRAVVSQATAWFQQKQQTGVLLDQFAPHFRLGSGS
jgi:outer membrane protein TolC